MVSATWGRCVVAVAVVVATPGGWASTSFGLGAAPGWSIDSIVEVRQQGQSLELTGSGCPSSGAVPAPDGALRLRLTPPTGGNAWYPVLVAGEATVISTGQLIAGEVDVALTPAPDGTFSASIPIPGDAPAGTGYSVRGICLSVLELDPNNPSGFTQASFDASLGEAGTLTVEAVVDATTTAPTASTNAPGGASVTPAFTG